MKPTNKRERECWAIHEHLKDITDRQREEIAHRAFYASGTQYMNGDCFCHECGHEFMRETDMWELELLQNGGEAKRKRPRHVLKKYGQYEICTCPNCHKRLRMYPYDPVRGSRTRRAHFSHYFAVLECVGKYQIIRTFETIKIYGALQPAEYSVYAEVSQRYVDMEKREVACTMALPINGLAMGGGRGTIPFRYDQPMTIKKYYGSYWYGQDDTYNYDGEFLIRSLHPDLRRARYERLHDASAEAMLFLLKNPHAETLCKLGEKKLYYLLRREGDKIWPQLKICLRHGYKIKDTTMWSDIIDALQDLHMDMHSPKYICPDNLKQMHDRLTALIRKKEEEARRKRAIEEAEKHKRAAANYEKFVAPFLEIVLKGKNMTITVLPTVRAFAEEGEAMHHCVYSLGYYKKHDRLILSARDRKKNRIATIEYMLESGNINQCRAVCNKVPERDAEIRALITKNRSKFVHVLQTTKQAAI